MNAVVEELNKLPEGWKRLPLKDAVHIILGQSPSSSTYNQEGDGLPFFQGKTEFGEMYPTVRKWCSEPKKIAEKEDILVSVRAPVGPTNLAPYECAIGRGLAALRPLGNSNTKYFLYLIRRYQNNLAVLGTGTTFEAISGDTLKNFIVPIAPPEQQKRIVAKIEELFSHIDTGIEALKKAKQLLKQYRQSVLKAAVTGELTKEWREENKDKLESTSQLLERILKERCQKWEKKQLEQFKAKNKMPKDGKWKDKYKELELCTTDELKEFPELPVGWIYTRLGNLTEDPKYGTSKKCSYDVDGKGVLRIPNIGNGEVDSENMKYALFDDAEIKTYELKEGDILTIRSNGSPNLVGKCALIRECDVKYLYAGYLIRLRPNKQIASGLYLIDSLNSSYLRQQIEFKAKSTSGVNNINSGELQSLIVSICGIDEQAEINSIVEEKLVSMERLVVELELQLIKAEKNKQSILATAFNGMLN